MAGRRDHRFRTAIAHHKPKVDPKPKVGTPGLVCRSREMARAARRPRGAQCQCIVRLRATMPVRGPPGLPPRAESEPAEPE